MEIAHFAHIDCVLVKWQLSVEYDAKAHERTGWLLGLGLEMYLVGLLD